MDRFEKTILFHLEHNLKIFRDKVIIDIAGMPTPLNKHLLAEGVVEVHGVNLDGLNASHGTPPRGYYHHVADARALPAEIPMADAVTACSALEHLSDFPLVLSQALGKLKSGGILVMHGGPLWPSILGHHVWVPTPKRNYYFGCQGDPLPPWGHLSHTEAELEAALLEQGLPAEHVMLICANVYHAQSKNRRSRSQLRNDFQQAGQLLLGFTEYRWGMPNPAIFNRIAERGHSYDHDDLMTGELVAVLRKF
jgi:hypothetical protein